MTGARFEFDEDAMAKLQRSYNAKAQDCIRQVDAELAGRPVSEVMEALRTRFITMGMKPDDENLMLAARDISNRTLRD